MDAVSTVTTYHTRVTITTRTTATCYLPQEPLHGFSNHINFTEVLNNQTSANFSTIPPGSPVMTYNISISNDGSKFSNIKTITLVDGLCFSCTGTCSQKVLLNDSEQSQISVTFSRSYQAELSSVVFA